MNMKNTRDVGNRLAPFFKAHGFTRKSNMFYKIQNTIGIIHIIVESKNEKIA